MYQKLLLNMFDIIQQNKIMIEKNNEKLLELNDEIVRLTKYRDKYKDDNVYNIATLRNIPKNKILTSEEIHQRIKDIREGRID